MSALLETQVRCSTFIRGDIERVYDLFATARGLDAWFTTGATVDARAGGEIVYRWKDWGVDKVTTEARGRVHLVQPPHRFVFEWDSADVKPTTVEIDLQRADGGTIVRLREYGFENTPRGRQCLAQEASGWGEALTLVKFYVEHGLKYFGDSK